MDTALGNLLETLFVFLPFFSVALMILLSGKPSNAP